MDADFCLWCDHEENYNRNSGIEYICGSCVQMLFNASQDELKRTHTLAIEKGRGNKARAIEFFIIPEEIQNEQRRPKHKISRFHFNRKRSFRPVRHEKDRVRLSTA